MDVPIGKQETELAARRLEQIMACMRGEKSATQAAEALGVSRQTFYEWYNRALDALRDSLQDRTTGRPPTPPEDPAKIQLERRVSELQRQVKLLENAILIRDVLDGVPRFTSPRESAAPSSRSKKKR